MELKRRAGAHQLVGGGENKLMEMQIFYAEHKEFFSLLLLKLEHSLE
jgi:hypothetical protein